MPPQKTASKIVKLYAKIFAKIIFLHTEKWRERGDIATFKNIPGYP